MNVKVGDIIRMENEHFIAVSRRFLFQHFGQWNCALG